jgi:hypothetical protein
MDRDPSTTDFDESTRRHLARLADGTLDGFERAELEARVAASPTLRAALERQRTGAAAIRSLELEAPAELRERIAAHREARRRSPRRRWAIGGSLAAATAAAAVIAVLVMPSGEGGPTVPQAASLYRQPATAAVEVNPSSPKLLAAQVEGVPFPNWSGEFGWRAVGTRSDRLDDRTARTVFYRKADKRIAYTIVSGDGIHAPAGSQPARLNGVNLHTFQAGDRRAVTWWRNGRTCVVSATGVGDRELLKLASWKGDGAVPF